MGQDRVLSQQPHMTQDHRLNPYMKHPRENGCPSHGHEHATSRRTLHPHRTVSHHVFIYSVTVNHHPCPRGTLLKLYRQHLARDSLNTFLPHRRLFSPAREARGQTASTAPMCPAKKAARGHHLPVRVMCRCKTHTDLYLDQVTCRYRTRTHM